MSIGDQLRTELIDAIRAKDQARKNVIRAIQTEVATARTEPGFDGNLDDSFYVAVIAGFVKRLEKSQVEYRALGERGVEAVDRLEFEANYLSRWLPKKVGEPETRILVQAAIAEQNAAGDPKAMGRIIGAVMRMSEGLDGSLVSRLVREELE